MSATATDTQTTMQALVRRRYGSPDRLELARVETPELTADGVLVRVHASSVNRADWYALAGKPALARPMMGGVLRPRSPLLGGDFAGVAEAVGKDVTDVQPGDEVFGSRSGAFAEYVCARVAVAARPANVGFEEAAAVPLAGLTALQGLRDHGRLAAGQRVLVNGGSGGVGTFAVQIAKALGAEVTAVCSTRNVELVRSLGADRVLDYARDDFTRGADRYDVILDVAGSRSWFAYKRVLVPKGTLVVVGAPMTTPLVGPLGHIAATRFASIGSSAKAVFFVAKFNRPDLATLRELVESGAVRPVITGRYELADAAAALREMGEGHVQGKLVVSV